NPRHPDALNFLGVVAMQTGNIADAEMWCARAIQSGGGPEAYNNYGETQRIQGKLDMAGSSFERAIQLDAGYGEAWCNLGLVQAQAGQVDRAVGSLLKAVQLEPQLVQAHFNLGVVFNQQGKP